MLTANTKAPQRGSKQTAQEWRHLLPCHPCAVAGRNAVLPLRWLSTSGSHCANVGGHASQRDTCHVCAAYVLLRRWERLRGGASAGMASPPTLPRMCCCVAGKGYGAASLLGNGVASYINLPYFLRTRHVASLHQPSTINHHPSPNTQHPTKKWALPVVDGSAFHYACYEKK